jgi:hypothetical protein
MLFKIAHPLGVLHAEYRVGVLHAEYRSEGW